MTETVQTIQNLPIEDQHTWLAQFGDHVIPALKRAAVEVIFESWDEGAYPHAADLFDALNELRPKSWVISWVEYQHMDATELGQLMAETYLMIVANVIDVLYPLRSQS